MLKMRPVTGSDIVDLITTMNTNTVAIIASMIQQQKPEQPFSKCVIQAIERVQAVDDPNLKPLSL
jgi:hypothetical protein